MTLETRHIVQPYRSVRRRLVPAEALSVRSAPVAKERALRFFETGRYAGVDAYSVTSDHDAGSTASRCFTRDSVGYRSTRLEAEGVMRNHLCPPFRFFGEISGNHAPAPPASE